MRNWYERHKKKNQFFPRSLSKSKLMIGPMPLLLKSIPIPLSNFKKIIYINYFSLCINHKKLYVTVVKKVVSLFS